MNKTIWDPILGQWVKTLYENVGNNVRFNISIHNNGTNPLINIIVTDVLPLNLEYANNATPVETNWIEKTITWIFPGLLYPCNWTYIEFDAFVNNSGNETNNVTVTAICETTGKEVYEMSNATVYGQNNADLSSWSFPSS